jgi:hypothetical protein
MNFKGMTAIVAGALCLIMTATGAEVTLHVSPKGADTAPGSAGAPLATLERARDLMREMREKTPELLSEGATVWVHGGTYERANPFTLEARDSGTALGMMAYRAAPGESPVLLGGRVLPIEAFQPVTDDTVLKRLDPAARDAVRRADLRALGITDLGVFPDAFSTPPVVPELFFDGKRMTLARWPNGDEWATVASVVDSGPAPWRNQQSQDTGTFEFSGDRPARWTAAPAVWLYGYWCFDWASETVRVKSIDTAARRMTLASPHVYGIGSGNKAERRFCALNLLEEIDAPGEYYVDRENGCLYFWPPAAITADSVLLSLLREPVVQITNAAHIKLRGLTVACSAGTGVQVDGGEAVQVLACNVRNTGRDGVVVKEGTGHRVEACDISETGTNGVTVDGGDRKTLTPCNHSINNNDIWNVARRQRTATYNVHLGGVGVRLAHNSIHDAPHQAIGLGGNDHVIEFNDVYRICQESDDCGAFYMGRNPSERGTVIRHNFWHDTGGPRSHGSCAVYFDDGAGGQTVYGNVFLRAAGGSFGAVFVHGGHDNRVVNNIFIDCKAAMRQVRWADKGWREWLDGELWQDRLLKEVDITKPPYSERYPELKGFLEFNGEPRMNHSERNLVVRCPMLLDGDWDQRDNYATDSDPGFVDAAGMNFALKEDSEVFKKIPGFEKIPFGEIGLVRDELRPELPKK